MRPMTGQWSSTRTGRRITMKNQSTNETCPIHIWKHEVQVAALALGGDAETMRESDINEMVVRWYEAGEPVWMAADSLAFVSKQRAKANRAESEAAYYKRMAAAYKETAEDRA